MKICPKCKVRPSIRNEKKNYAPYCLECSSEYSRNRNSAKRDIITKAKDKPCMDCGMKYPHYVMDLDHRRGIKLRNVSQMHSYSLKKLLEEIEKCDVVCANCHRIRTNGPVA